MLFSTRLTFKPKDQIQTQYETMMTNKDVHQ